MIDCDERNKRKETKSVTYKEARVYLDEVSKYGSVLGLDTIRGLLNELGNPQDELQFIHIAGTNGKGSVLSFVSTILSETGMSVGRYVSPTVVSYLERIQVNGRWISEEDFTELVEEVQKAVVRMEANGKASPTVFEMETAIAFLYFQKMRCGVVVLETGLGGDQDATNVIKNTAVAVFAAISRDHMRFLGETPGEIAGRKAGIIKPGCVVVSAAQEPEVRAVLEDRAADLGCPVYFAEPDLAAVTEESCFGQTISYKEMKDIRIRMAGRYQILNAATAYEVISAWNRICMKEADDAAAVDGKGAEQHLESRKAVSPREVKSGFAKAVWPGRFTCISRNPLFLVDGAHNEDAAGRLRETLETYFPGKRFIYIMGIFKDKEYERIAEIMAPLAGSIYTVSLPDRERTLKAEQLKDVTERYCTGSVQAAESIEQAVDAAWKEAGEQDVILAFGSLSYLGQVMELADGKKQQNMREQR